MAPAFIQDAITKIDRFLEQENSPITKALKVVEKKTNIKSRYLAFAGLSIIAVYLIVGYAAALLCSVIGFVYPAYCSVKAIESKKTEDDTEWLIYWVVYATFSCAEFFSDILLSWFPFYYLLKCTFLIWCMAPVNYNGSKLIYNKLIRPWVLKNEHKIDEVFGYVTSNAGKIADKVTGQAETLVKNTVQKTIDAAIEATVEGDNSKKSE